MRIFLSASIRGGRQMLSTYMDICSYLQDRGHEVLSWHVADPELEKSDCLIAEVSTPSIGVGYEVCSALNMCLPVLCLHTLQANVSAMILGDRRIISKEYQNSGSMRKAIDGFLEKLNGC
jgi:hypothetical protein